MNYGSASTLFGVMYPSLREFPFCEAVWEREHTSHHLRPPTSANTSTTHRGVMCNKLRNKVSKTHTWLCVDCGTASEAGRMLKWVTNAKTHVPTTASSSSQFNKQQRALGGAIVGHLVILRKLGTSLRRCFAKQTIITTTCTRRHDETDTDTEQ